MKKTTRNLIVIALALTIVLSALALVACKRNETYTVTFVSNGGSAVDSITDVKRNSTIDEPASPHRDGFIFEGWYSDKGLNKLWKFAADKVKGNMTLYAKWTFVPTDDLAMMLNSDGTAYAVAGIGNAKGIENIVIPVLYKNLPVTAIAINAFAENQTITSVYVPNSVTVVGNGAFDGCSNLVSVTFDCNAELGLKMFNDCAKLERVVLPQNMTAIKKDMFRSCKNLTDVTIPSGVTSIAEEAFFECEKLTDVKLPSKLTSIANKAFAGCIAIKQVTLPSSLRDLGKNVFAGCHSIESLQMTSSNSYYYASGNCIISIEPTGNKLVVGCKNSEIPADRVKIIGEGAFTGCKELTSIVIPNCVETIEDYAFSGCEKLKNIAIPSYVTSIGAGAFSDCASLAIVAFGNAASPSQLQTIGKEAFARCNISGFNIPHSVTSIGEGALYQQYSPALTVSYDGTVEELDNITIIVTDSNTYGGTVNIICEGNRSVPKSGLVERI